MLSFIIPIYNVDKYLSKCLDSILKNTNPNFEVILVNDGSTDNSKNICEEYCKIDSRIKLINKKNEGLACARNSGLDIAQYEFISFVDSDDWIAESYVEHIIKNFKEEIDCLIFSHDTNYVKLNTIVPVNLLDETKIDKKKIIRVLDRLGNFNIAWNKIYRKSVIEQSPSLRFVARSEPGEDLIFNCEYFERIKNISTISKNLYQYMRYDVDSEANRYRKNLYEKNFSFYMRKKEMYENLNMKTYEDKLNIAECCLAYIFACIPNMYRKKTTFLRKERMVFFREILNSPDILEQMLIVKPKTTLHKQFVRLYKTKNIYLLDFVYFIQCFLRNNLHNSYKIFRKIISK